MPDRVAGPVEGPAQPLESKPVDATEPAPEAPAMGAWAWALLTGVLLLAAWAAWQWGGVLTDAWHEHPALALFLALLTAGFVALLGRALLLEFRAMRQVDRLRSRNQDIARSLADGDLVGLRDHVAPTLELVRARRPALVAEFDAAVRADVDAAAYARLLENLVLCALDDEADRVIRQQALAVGAAVAAVPHPSLDALVVLWRALALSRRVAEIYGLAPTGLSTLRLAREALISAMLAGGTDALFEATAEEFGSGLAGPAAEFAVVVLRMRRTGRLAQRLCRPLPRGRS